MDDLVKRLRNGVQQREVRWPGNDGSDMVTDRGGANKTMDEAANRIVVLEEALSDLLTWFPDEPSDPEWRLKGGANGADDAVEAARAAVAKGQDDD